MKKTEFAILSSLPEAVTSEKGQIPDFRETPKDNLRLLAVASKLSKNPFFAVFFCFSCKIYQKFAIIMAKRQDAVENKQKKGRKMKRKLLSTLSVMAFALGVMPLMGVEFPVTNSTPFAITRIEIEDDNEKEGTLDVTIPAGATKTIQIPSTYKINAKESESILTFHFENGGKCYDNSDNLTKVRSIKVTYSNSVKFSLSKRGKRTNFPVGQIKIEISGLKCSTIEIRPLSDSKPWQPLVVANAKKSLYSVPLDGKYKVRFTVSGAEKSSYIYSNGKKGYDFKQLRSLSLKLVGFVAKSDEPDED